MSAPKQEVAAPPPVDLVTYYTEAGMDYRAWSRNFNMHFGFYRWGLNPLALESMLEEMSRQVFRRLALRDGMKVLDLGCGLGAPTRALIEHHDVATTAVTKVEWQLEMAQRLSEGISARGSVEWKLGDFTALDLPSRAYQAAFSIEASCHAEGADKEPFIQECARLLAPGAKLVVADGFMKKSVGLPRWYAALLNYMNRSWAVERFADLAAFCACLEKHGLTVLAAEEISWSIAPSVLHVPRVTIKFLFSELLLRHKNLTGVRWGHVLACLIAPWIGLGRPYFGYYLVTAQKR
ncbi:MAG TPA: methyltransferase domain-containing protein [Thermoanaerobaculia bacterium]|nr:methyltransferase domain-containing protein [Thermoanaerobaculia bacterium]